MTCRIRRSTICVGLALLGLSVGGCFGAGGCQGDALATGGMKVMENQMTTLTSAEVLAIDDYVRTNVNPAVPALTEAQASALVAFFQLNQINSIEDAQSKVLAWQTDPSSILLPPGFLDLFGDLALESLPALLGSLGGPSSGGST